MTLLQIFKAGRHTAMSGATLSFSESDLQASVAAYNPELHEAPLVVGHPKDNGPAYGWVKSLAFADGILSAEPDQVDAEFAELVNSGRFKKISASFYTPDAPANPVPGVYYLRHVGFLGAQPPAVKGLKSASFSDSEEGVVAFGDWSDRQNAGLWRRFREFLIEKFGQEDADKVVPSYAVEDLEDSARTPSEPVQSVPAFAEPEESDDMTKEELAAQKAALEAKAAEQAQKESEFAERESKLAEAEAKRIRAEIAEFADGLVQAGKLLPVHRDGLVEFMARIDAASVVEFGEGEGKTTQPAMDWIKHFLGTLPKQVAFGEVGEGADPVDLDDANSIAKQALDYQEAQAKKGFTVSVTEAVRHVTKGA